MPIATKIARLVRTYRIDGFTGLKEIVGRRLAAAPVAPTYDPTLINDVLVALSRRSSFSVVQIGAFVGNSFNDPLYEFLSQQLPSHPGSIAVLVEPAARHFRSLQSAYADIPGAVCEQVAIADRSGVRELHTVDADPVADGMPEWLDQLSSLRADRMTAGWDRYEAQISEEARAWQAWYLRHRVVENVECITLTELLGKYQITSLDLLQIDTEGYDYEILKTIDFGLLRPLAINFERVHLGDAELACREMLYDAGYVLFDWGQDTLALRLGTWEEREAR